MDEPVIITAPLAVDLRYSNWLDAVNVARERKNLAVWPGSGYRPPRPIGRYYLVDDNLRAGHLVKPTGAGQVQFPFEVRPRVEADDLFQRIRGEEGLEEFGDEGILEINLHPLGPLNCVLASAETKPQLLDRKFLRFIVNFARANPSLVVFYHSWGGGATKNGLHAQTISAKFFYDNANMLLLEEHSRTIDLNGEESDAILWQMVYRLQREEDGCPFNLIISKDRCYVLERKGIYSTIKRGELTSDPTDEELISTPLLGAIDGAGIFIVSQKELNQLLKEHPDKAEHMLGFLYTRNFKVKP